MTLAPRKDEFQRDIRVAEQRIAQTKSPVIFGYSRGINQLNSLSASILQLIGQLGMYNFDRPRPDETKIGALQQQLAQVAETHHDLSRSRFLDSLYLYGATIAPKDVPAFLIRPGTRFRARPAIEHFNAHKTVDASNVHAKLLEFRRKEARDAYYACIRSKLIVVEVPYTQQDVAFTWGVLAHELYHYSKARGDLYMLGGFAARQAMKHLKSKQTEILCDFAAYLTAGPAFAVGLAETTRRYGRHPGPAHASAGFRLSMLKQLMEWDISRLSRSSGTAHVVSRRLCELGVREIETQLGGNRLAIGHREKMGLADFQEHGEAWISSSEAWFDRWDVKNWQAWISDAFASRDTFYRWRAGDVLSGELKRRLDQGVLPASNPGACLNFGLYWLFDGEPDNVDSNSELQCVQPDLETVGMSRNNRDLADTLLDSLRRSMLLQTARAKLDGVAGVQFKRFARRSQ